MDAQQKQGAAWRELEPELKVLGSVLPGQRLRVTRMVEVEKLSGIAASICRFVSGESRQMTLRWLCDLRSRLDVFCSCCASQARVAALWGEGPCSTGGDVCPQCSRLRCACVYLGLLRALDADVGRGIEGITKLSITYSDDRCAQKLLLEEREKFKQLKNKLSEFLVEHEA